MVYVVGTTIWVGSCANELVKSIMKILGLKDNWILVAEKFIGTILFTIELCQWFKYFI